MAYPGKNIGIVGLAALSAFLGWRFLPGRVSPFVSRVATTLSSTATLPGADSADEAVVFDRWWRMIPFSDSRGKWGYRTRVRRHVIIPPRFDQAEQFINGYARVAVGGQEAFIDVSGEKIFSSPAPIVRELHAAKTTSWLGLRSRYGYVDRSGRYRIPPIFENAQDFSQGLAAVRINGKYGYIDKAGTMVIEPRFTWAGPFSEGLAAVMVDDREGYIDTDGEMVISPRFYWADKFSEDRAAVMVKWGRWGYVDRKGEMVINPEFKTARPFFSGYARVETDDTWSYINREGEKVLTGKIAGFRRIQDPGFPHSQDLAGFSASGNIAGYHPERGLIFNDRGWAYSPVFRIPEGKYLLQIAAEGATGIEIAKMMKVVLIPVGDDGTESPHITGGSIFIPGGKSQHRLGPWNVPAGGYKISLFQLNGPVTYCESAGVVYDSDFYVAVEDMTIIHAEE